MALHHRVLPAPYSQPGSWLVGHAIPGLPGAYAIDGDALTEASAAAYARSLNDSYRGVHRDDWTDWAVYSTQEAAAQSVADAKTQREEPHHG